MKLPRRHPAGELERRLVLRTDVGPQPIAADCARRGGPLWPGAPVPLPLVPLPLIMTRCAARTLTTGSSGRLRHALHR